MCGLLISSSSRLLVHNSVVRIDTMLLTDVNGLLSGIVPDKVIFSFLDSSFDDCVDCRLVSIWSSER